MNIFFHDWKIKTDYKDLARQYDHLTREILVQGAPDGWTWDLLVRTGDALDLITLSPMEGGLGVTLTAEMLALSGYYVLQLRGTQGELVRHTNMIQILVPESMSGDAQWPSIPSEFSQAEANIRALNEHPPKPGPNGFWMLWDPDTDTYQQSEIPIPSGEGGMSYQIGNGLKITGENTLEVDTADEVNQDNTLPITAAAVYSTVGNIAILLGTI